MLNVIKSKWICLGISLVIILAGILSYFIQGFNLDIDFTGGTTIAINMEGKPFNIADMEKIISDTVGYKASNVQKSESDVLINISTPDGKALSGEQRDALYTAIKTTYTLSDANSPTFDSIDPTIGKELQQSAILCCLLALVLMLTYITIRFELWSGVAAVISLAHNVLVLLSIYSIFQLNINTTFIAAILTIVGYTINDTIVTFDRIRELARKVRKTPFSEITNRGVNETLTRSINTSVTTLLTIVVLYIIGVTSIKEFAIPIIIGIAVGTYSSIFIASPLWAMFKKDDVAVSNNKNK